MAFGLHELLNLDLLIFVELLHGEVDHDEINVGLGVVPASDHLGYRRRSIVVSGNGVVVDDTLVYQRCDTDVLNFFEGGEKGKGRKFWEESRWDKGLRAREKKLEGRHSIAWEKGVGSSRP